MKKKVKLKVLFFHLSTLIYAHVLQHNGKKCYTRIKQLSINRISHRISQASIWKNFFLSSLNIFFVCCRERNSNQIHSIFSHNIFHRKSRNKCQFWLIQMFTNKRLRFQVPRDVNKNEGFRMGFVSEWCQYLNKKLMQENFPEIEENKNFRMVKNFRVTWF